MLQSSRSLRIGGLPTERLTLDALTSHLPRDRRRALLRGELLPDRAEGAVLRADISGVGQLTETLVARRGPTYGAEALARWLNLVYDALIGVVEQHTGIVMTISSDAMFCWFAGDDGSVATTCALAMQRVMAEVKDGAGDLGMRVAVVRGPVRRFVVGDPTVQVFDLLAGATLDQLASAARQIASGEVALVGMAAAQISERLTISAWREGVAVVTSVAPPSTPLVPVEEADEQELSPEMLRPWLLAPVYERLRQGQRQFLAETRSCVIVSLRFGYLDYDTDLAAGERLDAFVRRVQGLLVTYGGSLLQLAPNEHGGTLRIVFGAPVAHDDDLERAIAATLDLLAAPTNAWELAVVQAGMAQGRVWTGHYGGRTRQVYDVCGAEVLLADQLMRQAQIRHLLAPQRLAMAVTDRYRTRPLGPLSSEGRHEASVALILGRRQAITVPASHGTGPLIGREQELALLGELLDTSIAGQRQIVCIDGVAGVGKSALLTAVGTLAMRRSMRPVVGVCQHVGIRSAYAPWRQIVSALLELDQPHVIHGAAARLKVAQLTAKVAERNPDWLLRLPLLSDFFDLPIPDNTTTAAFEPRRRQEALVSLVVELVLDAARRTPLLITLDDMHWMDEPSLALTLTLARAAARSPLMILLSERSALAAESGLRSELHELPGFQRLMLRELSLDASEELATLRLRGPVAPLALSFIQAKAQGHPFFIEELANTLREAGTLERRDDGLWWLVEPVFQALREARFLSRHPQYGYWTLVPDAPLAALDLGIPDSVQGIVLARIDRLPEEQKLTLKVASVIGQTFDLDVLEQVHPARLQRDQLLAQIHALEQTGFVGVARPTRDSYSFNHSITQEVVYATLLEAQRRDLHRVVGAALEVLRPEAVEALADHYQRGEQYERMLFYLDLAAQKAQREYANETALSYYRQALAHELRWQWQCALAEVLHLLGQREQEAQALCALSANVNVPVFEAAYRWGEYYEAIGDYTAAQAAFEEALADYRQRGDRIGKARCHLQLGVVARRRGEYAAAAAWLEQSQRLLDGPPHTGEEARLATRILNELGTIYLYQGQYDEARSRYAQALAISQQSGNREGEAYALNNLGIVADYQRQFHEARNFYQQALELRRTIGDRAGESVSLHNLSVLLHAMGDYSGAQRHSLVALEIQQIVGNRWDEINSWNNLGIQYQELGDLEQAEMCLRRGLELSQAIGDRAGQAYILANLGLVARDRADLVTAYDLLSEGLELARSQEDRDLMAWLLSYLASVSLLSAHTAQAISEAEESITIHQELGVPENTTSALATLAAAYLALGDQERARAIAHQALTILDISDGAGLELPQRDYLACARVLLVCGDDQAAERALRSAYAIVRARADTISDPELRQSFLERATINRAIVNAYHGGTLRRHEGG